MTGEANLVTLDQALSSSPDEAASRFAHYMNPDLLKLLQLVGMDRLFRTGDGCILRDDQGVEYLDFIGGYGALGLGHNHPELDDALESVRHLPDLMKIGLDAVAAALAETLAAVTPAGLNKTFFCNSGAEAVEGALKLARAASGRSGLLSCEGSFHGKTFGALSVSGRPHYKEPFEPLLPGCATVPYGDADALREALSGGSFAAFIVEPIQGEGGVIIPPEGYLRAARAACSETGTLLIVDEIQTGFGRTGTLFCVQQEDVSPDLLTIAKTLGGGIMPIGAFMATDDVWAKGFGGSERCILHTSTFGGNARACAVGLKAIEIIVRDDLPARAAVLGARLAEGLQDASEGVAAVREVRGRGLLVGVEFSESRLARDLSREYFASEVAAVLAADHHVVTAYTLNNPSVIRFEPPLIVTEEQIDHAIEAFSKTLRSHGSFARASIRVGLDLMKRKIGGRS